MHEPTHEQGLESAMEEGGAVQTPAPTSQRTTASSGDKGPPLVFPTAKYTFTIFSPRVVTFDDQNATQQDLIQSMWKGFTFSPSLTASEAATESERQKKKKKKVKVKMGVLVVKMLNRLIKDKILQRESIQFISGNDFVFVQALVASSALPILMKQCQWIGVGSAVGVCYATPIETAEIPPPGPIQELSTDQTMALTSPTALSPSKAEVHTVSTTDGGDESDEDAEYIDSPRDDDEDATSSPPRSIKIALLSRAYKKELAAKIVAAREEWLQTASRIRVAQVAEEVAAGAALSWDYTAFVLCAASVAAIGLGTDSATTTIASMLISPIMGPVMGATFGTTIRNRKLIRISLRNEAVSLIICVLVGMFWGIISTVADAPETRNWPSQEMINRGDPFGLSSGVLVALPSGVATALSTLGRNSSGMVGVAISLSLLPPAVNAGMCWAYAAMLQSDSFTRNQGDDTDYAQTGGISLALTFVNILCIWLAGVATFWLKEVAPVTQKNAFWSRDVQNYREQQAQDKPPEVDTEVINEGILAALELQQDAGRDVYEGDFEMDLSKHRVAAARRQGLAGDAWEDALFLKADFGLEGEVIVGGAADNVIPDEAALENIKKRKSVADSLIRNANQFGGLGEAGEALFDDNLVASLVDTEALPSDADGVIHENVAKKILLEKYD